MIDYNTLTIEETIAKGMIIETFQQLYTYVCMQLSNYVPDYLSVIT